MWKDGPGRADPDDDDVGTGHWRGCGLLPGRQVRPKDDTPGLPRDAVFGRVRSGVGTQLYSANFTPVPDWGSPAGQFQD